MTSSRAYAEPPDRREPEAPAPREVPHARLPPGRRGLLGVILAGTALLLVGLLSHAFDESVRRTLEGTINGRLHGYHVALGHAHVSPLGLSLILRDAVIRQDANPEPPVADVPWLRAGVEWSSLLRGHLVADALLSRPRVHVDLTQLRQEVHDPTKLKDRGWQQAFESIYPLKFNRIEVKEGDLVYIDADPARPLHVSRLSVSAANIRNIRSRDRAYPSAIHADGVVFATGRAFLNGNADFLAEPYPGVHALYRVDEVPLDRLGPIVRKANVTLSGGTLSSRGEIEYAPRHREARIADVTLRGLRLDYVHTAATAAAEKARGKKVEAAVREAARNPEPPLVAEVRSLRLIDADLGLITPVKDRRVRLYVDGAGLAVTNLSTGFHRGPVQASLTGRFLGSGAARGAATFRAPGKGPDFDLRLAVNGTRLPALNDLFRAYGKLDVARGTFSAYTEIKVHDGRIEGYLKPLFKDVQVYDPRQDAQKPVLKKLYEKVAGGVAHLLESHQREEVATIADFSGPLSAPDTSTWEIVARLLSNAFVKAIRPGFEHEYQAARAQQKNR